MDWYVFVLQTNVKTKGPDFELSYFYSILGVYGVIYDLYMGHRGSIPDMRERYLVSELLLLPVEQTTISTLHGCATSDEITGFCEHSECTRGMRREMISHHQSESSAFLNKFLASLLLWTPHLETLSRTLFWTSWPLMSIATTCISSSLGTSLFGFLRLLHTNLLIY